MPVTPTGVGIGTLARIAALGTTNATSVKATPGQVYKGQLYNNAAYAVFLKFYNKASAPTVGTDIPVIVVGVPATATGAAVSFDLDGFNFSLGIAYAITKLIADSDTTVVVANDLQGGFQYQ